MAAANEILRLRRLINDYQTPYTYTDEELGAILDESDNDYDQAAEAMWLQIAASYSTMVNVSESGSSRNNSDLYKNALAQAKFFSDRNKDDEIIPVSDQSPFTVQSVRP